MTTGHASLVPMTLERVGRLDWPAFRALAAGMRCAWADLDGFHVRPAQDLPQLLPVATHLWAWDGHRSVRARIDQGQLRVAVLHTQARARESVDVSRRPGLAWGAEDRQVGPLGQDAQALDFELLEISGGAPVTFVRAEGQ